MTEHLIRLGHRRIALLYTSPEYSSVNARMRGYKAALSAAGLGSDEDLLAELPRKDYFDETCVHGVLDRWLALDQPPSAIMTVKDDCALQVIRQLRRRGMAVPDDMAVTGYDDYRHFLPHLRSDEYRQLTTVRQNLPEIGRQAVLRVIAEIEGDKDAPLQVVVPAKIVRRGSCGVRQPEDDADESLAVLGSGHLTF